jgi:hypothetical protein
MRALFTLPIALVLATGQVPITSEQSSVGALAGTVLDCTGQPLADATVVVRPEKNMVKEFRAQTDAQGGFLVTNIPAGGVYVDAFKESEGYPHVRFAFFRMPNHSPYEEKLTIRAGETTVGAVIRLGVKAAVLRFKITDEKGKPIGAAAEFQRPHLGRGGNLGTSLQPDQMLLVPPVPFRFTVERDGYAPWHYGGDKWDQDAGLVRLQSGQTLEVAVQLRLGGASPTATTASIQGTVFGPDDEPLATAPVEAEADDHDISRRRLTTSTTAGTFVINGLPPGTFQVWAWQSRLGYTQDMASPFFAIPGREFPVVTVAAGTVANAEIHLGPRNARVNMVISDEKGERIKSTAHTTFSRPDVPETLEKEVRDRAFIAIPPMPVRVTVKADGYAEWHYGGDKWQETAGLLSAAPGEIVDLRVQLRPTR